MAQVQDGDQVITLVDITQPRCALDYGNTPCTAILGTTGDDKCFKTRATCQDPTNYTPTDSLTIRYCKNESIPDIYGRCIPSILSVNITSGQINIGAMDRSVSPFGRANVADVSFTDHPSSDIGQDPYHLERISGVAQADGIGYNPEDRGTYWSKWLARNPYYSAYTATIYRGSVGMDVADMAKYEYIVDQFSGPTATGASVTFKDIFSQVTDRKAQTPPASRGQLVADLAAGTTTSFTVDVPAGFTLDDEYPSVGQFRVAIGKEVILVTRSGGTFTIVTRGDIGTVAADHDADDTVQLVRSYVSQTVTAIVRDLLITDTIIPDADIPLTKWNAEQALYFPDLYTTHIIKPTPTKDLIGELAEQAGFSIWPDISTGLIEIKALEPQALAGDMVDEAQDILTDKVAKTRQQQRRVSQVWVHYGVIDPSEDLDDTNNYRTTAISADLAASGDDQYQTVSVRQVFSRWIPQLGLDNAERVGSRILSLFRDPPLSVSFNLPVTRDLPFELAKRFNLTLRKEVGFTGLQEERAMVPTQIERGEDVFKISAQELKFFVPPASARRIVITDDVLDFNLRTAHDSLFAPISSGDEVVCEVDAVVGASVLAGISFNVGSWPAGVTINIVIGATGLIIGINGKGGNGGSHSPIGVLTAGGAGGAGGTGLYTRYAINVENNSIIAAGGGGGGGGGAAYVNYIGSIYGSGGGGGGAGAGRISTSIGIGGSTVTTPIGTTYALSSNGNAGTTTTGGAGGAGGTVIIAFSAAAAFGGAGGNGGNPAVAGTSGISGSFAGTSHSGGATTAGGAGGAAGVAVDGDSFITYTTLGTITGTRIN